MGSKGGGQGDTLLWSLIAAHGNVPCQRHMHSPWGRPTHTGAYRREHLERVRVEEIKRPSVGADDHRPCQSVGHRRALDLSPKERAARHHCQHEEQSARSGEGGVDRGIGCDGREIHVSHQPLPAALPFPLSKATPKTKPPYVPTKAVSRSNEAQDELSIRSPKSTVQTTFVHARGCVCVCVCVCVGWGGDMLRIA